MSLGDPPPAPETGNSNCRSWGKVIVARQDAKKYRRMVFEWWKYWCPRIELYDTIASLDRVVVTAATSKHLVFAFAPSSLVFSHAIYVFAYDDEGSFSVLQSSVHEAWARHYSSSLETRMRYTPGNAFETFCFPPVTSLVDIGKEYHEHRSAIMLGRQEGLTKTYNRFHNPDDGDVEIARLRQLHIEMDQAVADAYRWKDLDFDHDFYETKLGVRYTISEDSRRDVLQRLLAENHERYEEEVKAGLHGKKKGSKKKAVCRKRTARKKTQLGPTLFSED